MMTAEWKSPNKITALCPAKEGKGDIFIATGTAGLGTCNVSLRIYKETMGPLKEVATWMPEKFVSRRKARRSSPTEQDDPLGNGLKHLRYSSNNRALVRNFIPKGIIQNQSTDKFK